MLHTLVTIWYKAFFLILWLFRRGNNRTALLIMDPWLGVHGEWDRIIEERIIPLAKSAKEAGVPVFVLTNKNKKNYPIPSILSTYETLYHEDHNSFTFAVFLARLGIRNLVYVGFASEMCVIGRPMGMIPMRLLGYKIGFIPQCSAAENGPEMHTKVCTMISSWIADSIYARPFGEECGG